MIAFDRVGKRYPNGFDALSELSFALDAGEMAFVTGHSGAGKSTLLRLVALLERPTRGQVTVNGRNLGAVRRRGIARVRRGVGMVFQDHRLLLDRSVFDNVALPLVIAGVPREEMAKRVRAALDKVGLLEREKSAPSMLSAGEQQRVGIARAIVAKPPVLIADEPTGNLDPQLAAEIMGLFGEFQQVGTTVLVASHDLPLVKRMGKRVLVLDHGRLIDDFQPRNTGP
ncbi:MAG: cell division ATP-binding protein FtsE [Xanthomonadaceae bacterium]|nr:cell division ATP-binding protein FtsE [Xanthomonadaceae bacterium]MDE1886129.1 cell division ATP-binding protein FtsE [Xanthomonadaceae bacterium]MDE1960526.1 cell division ATP-binding protein FtsE [Xanthomonadaceae bacterium]MDE2084704.1 cell division ATP-binding protein FtsE [Xanthomonadaceae bacterium]MDE2256278.1 cell division ATP-binding protein FtsE [Xanthomonadaceae bacterium]